MMMESEVVVVGMTGYAALQTALTVWILKKTSGNSEMLNNGLAHRIDEVNKRMERFEDRLSGLEEYLYDE